jgi:hypothetical protein
MVFVSAIWSALNQRDRARWTVKAFKGSSPQIAGPRDEWRVMISWRCAPGCAGRVARATLGRCRSLGLRAPDAEIVRDAVRTLDRPPPTGGPNAAPTSAPNSARVSSSSEILVGVAKECPISTEDAVTN